MGDKTLMIRLIKPATLAAANSAFVIAYVLGNTSAKIKTRIVIINVARAMPLSPKVCVNNAVVREVAKMFTKLLPRRTDPINPSVSSVIFNAFAAPLEPLSACVRNLPREAAVRAVSLPENRAERSKRKKTAPIVIQKL